MHASFPELICGETCFLLLRDSPTHAQETWLFILIQGPFFFGEAIKYRLAHFGNYKIKFGKN